MKCSYCDKEVGFKEWFIYNYMHKDCLKRSKDNITKRHKYVEYERWVNFSINVTVKPKDVSKVEKLMKPYADKLGWYLSTHEDIELYASDKKRFEEDVKEIRQAIENNPKKLTMVNKALRRYTHPEEFIWVGIIPAKKDMYVSAEELSDKLEIIKQCVHKIKSFEEDYASKLEPKMYCEWWGVKQGLPCKALMIMHMRPGASMIYHLMDRIEFEAKKQDISISEYLFEETLLDLRDTVIKEYIKGECWQDFLKIINKYEKVLIQTK